MSLEITRRPFAWAKHHWVGCLLALLLPGICSAAPITNVLTTSHFIVTTDSEPPPEIGAFLDRAYDQFTNFFRGDDERKLHVRIFSTHEDYQSRIDHLSRYFLMDSEDRDYVGLYHRETGTSYIYFRRWNYSSRKLLLQVTSFQFHDCLRPWTESPSLPACEYGIAAHLSLHKWDGKNLELGVLPSMERANYPQIALDFFQNNCRGDFKKVVDGSTKRNDALSWALVSFLIQKDREHFDIWRRALNNGVDAPYAWEKQF